MRVSFVLILTRCFGCVSLVDLKGEFVEELRVSGAGSINFGYDLNISYPLLDPRFAKDRIERHVVREHPGNWINNDHPDKRSRFMKDRPSSYRYQTEKISFSETRESRFWSPKSKIRAKWASAFWYRQIRDSKSRLRDQFMIRKTPFHVRRILALDKNYETKFSERRNRRSCDGPNVNKKKDSRASGAGRNARKNDPDVWDDDADAATEEDGDEDTDEWDGWTDWSECSASCGCGRQVRWQHCIGKGCPFGLKRAQIRTCHLRDCNNKNLLSWLGMKG